MTTRTGYLTEIEKVIRDKYRCHATYVRTVFVHEKTAKGKTVWYGDVEVFDLAGCNDSKRCYAWQSAESGFRIVTVLRSNLVDSAHRAVQAAIFTGVQSPMVILPDDPKILRQRIEKARMALYDAALNAGDLEEVMQTTREIGESFSTKPQ